MKKPRLSIERARVFASGLDHPECVARHPKGHWYAGGEAGQIYEIDAQGKKIKTIAESGGFILGVLVSPDGKTLYACDLKKQCLWKLDLQKRVKKLVSMKGAESLKIQIPNHLCFLNERILLVTDSGSPEKPTGRILWFDVKESGRCGVWHPGPFAFSNGIGFDSRKKVVHVVCSFLPGYETIQVLPNGTAGKRLRPVKISKTVPDGIAIDPRGGFYLCCYAPNRIYYVSSSGKREVLMEDLYAHTLSNPTNIVLFGKRNEKMMCANLGRWHLTEIQLR